MTTDREAFLASFKEYLATTPAVELLNDYTYLLIYINHDPYDEQERYQYLVDAVSTVGTKFSQVDTWRAGCAKRQREDDNAFWECTPTSGRAFRAVAASPTARTCGTLPAAC